MARISYTGTGNPFDRMLNHAPEAAEAYRELRRRLNAGVVTPRLRMLSLLACDVANDCHY